MKKILAVLIFMAFLLPEVNAQKTDNRRAPSIGFSFVLNDYVTASRIRAGSVSSVLREKSWGSFREGYPGVAVSYFQGLHNKIDLALSMSGFFADLDLPSRDHNSGEQFMLETDASAQFKMLPETYTLIPYLSGGLGVSLYDGQAGAFVPLGVGLRVNIFNESSFFINSQYRVPLIADANDYHFFHGFGITGSIGKKKETVVTPAP